MNDRGLDLTSLRNAIAALSDSLAVVGDRDWFDRQPDAVRNTLQAGTIQHFEVAFELCIKMLRRYIEQNAASTAEVDAFNFRDLLRAGGEAGLIEDVESWFAHRTMRNITSHTYDKAKADRVSADAEAFMTDARSLLQRLEARNG
jgi:nucleotidyltransferase substrate binding protein (TIGR01987 family)